MGRPPCSGPGQRQQQQQWLHLRCTMPLVNGKAIAGLVWCPAGASWSASRAAGNDSPAAAWSLTALAPAHSGSDFGQQRMYCSCPIACL
jgi:hypothetical protein